MAASLGYEDHEQAPGDEMLAAAARIATGVDIPVTVDAEAGYRMNPAELVVRLKEMGAAGCNLEDTNHARGELRDLAEQADWLRAIRAAASDQGYGLVINARIDVFLAAFASGARRAETGRPGQRSAAARARDWRRAPTACSRSSSGSPTPWRASSRRPPAVNVLKSPRAPRTPARRARSDESATES